MLPADGRAVGTDGIHEFGNWKRLDLDVVRDRGDLRCCCIGSRPEQTRRSFRNARERDTDPDMVHQLKARGAVDLVMDAVCRPRESIAEGLLSACGENERFHQVTW